jgi:amidase
MPSTERQNAADAIFVPHDIKAPIRETADGPLAGLTCAVKDMYDIVGERTGGGNPQWLAAQQPATRHAAAVKRVLDAGTTIIGKTICDEFFYSVAGINAHYGTPPNIRAAGRIPGGSSSGSAAATAAGLCDFALGSDTGGSVRVPAALCGLYGLRPTHGRVDIAGAMPMAPSFDVVGWFAQGPGVFRKVGHVLLNEGRVDAPLRRVLIADDASENADGAVTKVLREVLRSASNILPTQSSVSLSDGQFDTWREAFRIMQAYETWQSKGDFITHARPALGPGVKERMEFASTVTKDQADAARRTQMEVRNRLRAQITPGTIVALPAAPCIAPKVGLSHEEMESFRTRVLRLTCSAGLAGLPQMSLPAGTVEGCPVSLSFIAWPGGDEALLDLANAMSRFLGKIG